MKVLKGRYDLFIFFFFPFLIIPVLLFIFTRPWLAEIYRVNLLCSLIAVIFLIYPSPARRSTFSRLAGEGNKLSWISQLFLIQFILNLFCVSLFYFLNHVLPISTPILLSSKLTISSLYAGLFPWGFYSLAVLTFKYFIYDKKNIPFVSSTLQPFFHSTALNSSGIAIDSYMRLLPLTLMSFFVAFFNLALISLLSHLFSIPLTTGVKLLIVLVSSLLLTLYSLQTTQSVLRYLIFHIPLIFLIIIFTIVVSLVVILFNTEPISTFIPNLLMNLFNFSDQNLVVDFKIVLTFIWFGLSILAAAVMSFLSKDFSGKQYILWSLITNVLGWGVIYYFEVYLLSNPYVVIFIVQISLLILFILLGKKTITYLIRANLPTQETIKPRPPNIFVRVLLQTSLLITFCYLLGGVKLISFLITISLLPPLVLIFMSLLALIKAVYSEE